MKCFLGKLRELKARIYKNLKGLTIGISDDFFQNCIDKEFREKWVSCNDA